MLSPGFTISNMAGAIEKQELLNLREHMWSPCDIDLVKKIILAFSSIDKSAISDLKLLSLIKTAMGLSLFYHDAVY
jgi:hypothetical protein